MITQCGICNINWDTANEILLDNKVSLIGYQVNFRKLELGYFLFNHNCETTFAVPAGKFNYLYTGPVYVEKKTGSAECTGYCLNQFELRPCPAKCECAYVREVLQVIKKQKNME